MGSSPWPSAKRERGEPKEYFPFPVAMAHTRTPCSSAMVRVQGRALSRVLREGTHQRLGLGLGLGLETHQGFGFGFGLGLETHQRLGLGLGLGLETHQRFGLGLGLGLETHQRSKRTAASTLCGGRAPCEELGLGLGLGLGFREGSRGSAVWHPAAGGRPVKRRLGFREGYG